MVSKEIIKERLKHLTDGRYMLNFITPMVKSEEQKQEIDKKKDLLDAWILELEKQVND